MPFEALDGGRALRFQLMKTLSEEKTERVIIITSVISIILLISGGIYLVLSAGINQINYKIWVDISMEMKIVNPLYQEILSMERKIMLVDIVFSGKVPEHYFQVTPQNEYLLTE